MLNNVIIICEMCGKEFKVHAAEVRRGKGKFCSLSCAGKKGAEKYSELYSRRGENNQNWKGGISKNNYRYKKIQEERYPDRAKARQKITDAIRSGKIEKKPCEICGYEPAEAHHSDYSKPFDVNWLCKKHHREIHGGMRFNIKKSGA